MIDKPEVTILRSGPKDGWQKPIFRHSDDPNDPRDYGTVELDHRGPTPASVKLTLFVGACILAAAFVLLLLSGCGPQKTKPDQVDEVKLPIVRYAALPADRLAHPKAMPDYPAGPITPKVMDDRIHTIEAMLRTSWGQLDDLALYSATIVAGDPACPKEPVK